MINIITLNGNEVASFNWYSIGSYNDEEVTQAITNDNKEPLFDINGVENINGLTYPFKINFKCNDERLSLTTNSILYSKILQDDKNNNPEINITNWLDNSNLRPVSNTTAPFSQWNIKIQSPNGTDYPTIDSDNLRYYINMEDLPAYTYNLNGVTSNLNVNYDPGQYTYYYHGANYSDIRESVDIDWLTWKDHYMTQVFNITTSEWTYKEGDELPVIEDYAHTYQPIDLKVRNLTNDGYSGRFITFDFGENTFVPRKFAIGVTIYQNEQAKQEGKYTLYEILLLDHILLDPNPTAQRILQDFNTTAPVELAEYVKYMEPSDKISQDFEITGIIYESPHKYTIYAPPYNIDHDSSGHEGYMANRFDIKYIKFEN